MNSREYIESGILELYVFGKLSEEEKLEVQQMAADNPAIRTEIAAIEQAVINLSHSVSPNISAETYDKIRAELLGDDPKVIAMKSKTNWSQYLGWAASVVILLGAAFMYLQMNDQMNGVINEEIEKSKSEFDKMQKTIVTLEDQNKATQTVLNIIRDKNNTVVTLGGQPVAPTAVAKVYWNKATQTVYIDAEGLPEAPQGMVYQVWALKLDPLTPTSIGLLEKATAATTKMYKVDNTTEAEAFGITLEPEGGSATPTMEQLYTLGKV
ncbi:anti-sigma factor [Flavobacterium saliperosum]|uniref:Anti-sigma-K factor rskA n=1 Tax=Flavobacterium saliperosum TaxID=329186 RepID=A0A1G4W1H8_9FLAO|nr:anti-sigma factor [Flavobacterium saliperosum]SCX14537.1 Anti-sigma-K factor rskA [Flavobacterium saliperosum]